MNGYIYVRNHQSYDVFNACKLGKASNIPERDSVYTTGEIKRGYFYPVYEVPRKQMGLIENFLKSKFNKFNIKIDAGTEFFNKEIIELIESHLIELKIKYSKLSREEIDNLIRCYRIKKNFYKKNFYNINFNKINKLKLIKALKARGNFNSYIPRNDQLIIIEKGINHYKNNEKGLLVVPCGVGKTIISLWITQKLNSDKITIGVPNKLLLTQWYNVIKKFFNNLNCLLISGNITVENIIDFLNKNKDKCIVITTYSSSYKLYLATQKLGFIFDMKINDEVHHLTSFNFNIYSEEERKTFINMLKINSIKQLSLTATVKLLENKEHLRNEDIIVSNDNIEYFGEIIDKKTLLWAITEKIICDYTIQTILSNREQLEHNLMNLKLDINENDKRLFLSAFISLKSINEKHSHHLLIYSNNMENSSKIIQYIELLLNENYFSIPDLYFSKYDSNINIKQQKEIISNFENTQNGIITCVYCLGEGWDFPLLDGVVFAENMSSNIRIVQSALRASRKNKLQPDKITKIILPILHNDDWIEDNNQDFKKVKEVIYQMGLEDETIEQKIKVFKIDVKKSPLSPLSPKEPNNNINEFGEYDEELTQKIRLKTIGRTFLRIGYEKARKIISEKNIKSKEGYYELCEKDIRLSKEPDIIYKGQFTNWIDYLSIERKYYDLQTCKDKINEYLSKYQEIKKNYLNLVFICDELSKLDDNFPPNGLWVEYYNVNELRDLITITNNKKKKISTLL